MHPIVRELLLAFVDGVKAMLPRQHRITRYREWCRKYMTPTTTATISAYSCKHYAERHADIGPCHINTDEFAEAAALEGFKVEPTLEGGRIYGSLTKEARRVYK
jgi:hypothetical protein